MGFGEGGEKPLQRLECVGGICQRSMRIVLNVIMELFDGLRPSESQAEDVFRTIFFFTHGKKHGLIPGAGTAFKKHLLIGEY
jgi:hypothetical protein